jgi:hypothetical protein
MSLTGKLVDGRKAQVSIKDYARRGLLPAGHALIPTPRAEGFDAGAHKGKPDSLHSWAKMLPTPQASDGKRGKAEHIINDKGQVQRKSITANGRPFSPQLTDIAPFLGTPRATLAMAKPLHPTSLPDKARLEQQVTNAAQASGSLNPRFVAQMMGFPPDWCELPARGPSS